jgi:hypothetical protein
MFVNLFDFQNQFLFVFLGYVYVSGSYFLLFVFIKVCLCLGGLLSFVCLFFEGMSMSLRLCILSSVLLFFQLMYVSICVFEHLCLSLKIYGSLCL